MGPQNERKVTLFFDGQEIGDVFPEITLSPGSENDEAPLDMNGITVTIKLNWWNRLKMRYFLWKIFRRKK